VFHVHALYYTKTLITNKRTKRALSSIITHPYMFRPCWVIFRENFFVIVTLRLRSWVRMCCVLQAWTLRGPGLHSESAGRDRGEFAPPKTTQYKVNSRVETYRSVLQLMIKTLFVHLLVISVFVSMYEFRSDARGGCFTLLNVLPPNHCVNKCRIVYGVQKNVAECV
jgi:hypothetical protein